MYNNNIFEIVMYVRVEATKDNSIVLVTDEIGRYFGQIHLGVFHKHCITSEAILEIDEYYYYTVDKEKILKYCKK